MRKPILVFAGAMSIALGLYAAAGYWLAPLGLRNALTDLAASERFTLRLADVHVNPFTLQVRLEGIEVGREGRVFASAADLRVDLAWASLWQRAWIVERLGLLQPRVDLAALPERRPTAEPGAAALPPLQVREALLENGTLLFSIGDLALESLRVQVHDVSTRAGDAGRFELAGHIAGGSVASRGRIVALAPLTLQQVAIEGTGLSYAGVELKQGVLEAQRLQLPPTQPIAFTAGASLAPHGEVHMQGNVDIRSMQAAMQVELDAIPLQYAGRWLPAQVMLTIVSGALFADGRLQIGWHERRPQASYAGSLEVSDLRVDASESDLLLLAWRLAQASNVKLQLSPRRVEVGGLVVKGMQGRLVREADGSINLVKAFAQPGTEPTSDLDRAAPADAALTVTLGRLRWVDGALHFTDRALDSPFEMEITALSGDLTGFSTASGDPARLALEGRVEPAGALRAGGTINLEAPRTLAVVDITVRGLRLPSLEPYVVRFAGYRIASGLLSAHLRYEVRDGRLHASNELVFERLRLGEKVEGGGVLDLPLELAIALLADASGCIDLRIPVSGNLDEPDVDLGGLVARAVGRALGNIVAAPFRAIAGLLAGERDEATAAAPDSVSFHPGDVQLSPPDGNRLARIARALQQRPGLGVVVRGGYADAADRQAIRRHVARREIARRAGVPTGDALDLYDPRIIDAAEALYLQRVGSRLEMLALREQSDRWGPLLVERIAATTPVPASAARELGALRAQRIEAALVERGVDADRIRIEAPIATEAGTRGVPTQLSLIAADRPPAPGSDDVSPTGRCSLSS